jgi:carbamoyl-phosphate synthase large subunit
MSKRKISIALTGLNNTDNPGPGVPVIRGIRESDVFDARIIGLAYENLEPAIFMHDVVDKTYQVPYPSEGSEVLVQRILEINDKDPFELLIPNFDAELYAFMRAEETLKKAGIRTFLPTLEQFEDRHKSNLRKPIFKQEEIEELKEDFEYPLMVKGKFYDAYLAYNAEQVKMHYNKISAKWGLPIIIQEFIKGTEVNVVALGDGKGNTVGAVPMRKQYITDKGKAWAGITLDDNKLLDLTDHIISSMKWRGGMELEIVKSFENELFVIEINPRIPAWVYLAVGAGQNLPEALVKLALGMEVDPYTEYEVGKMFIRYSNDLITDLKEFEKLSTLGEL